ncbi:hypothetical protein J4436_03510 [Candidatus Woesearchaeota archaeon]|nr:hypothetical protein [Candidatus Woesearchaeota archaeon]
MKHEFYVILVLVLLFIGTHFIGLTIINEYNTRVLPFNIQRMEITQDIAYLPVFIAILVASIIALIMIKFRTIFIWKIWFFLSLTFCLTISFSSFFSQYLSLIVAVLLSLWRLTKPNFLIHNFTELFLYGGLAALFVPIFNIFSISLLLILISIYDMISVWKTKHMIELAKFQNKAKIFTGLLIPYGKKKKEDKKVFTKEAILGGGDIGFTLLFSGVILLKYGIFSAIITSLITSIALLLLFIFGEKKKFYPAMPFLSVACFISLGLIQLF